MDLITLSGLSVSLDHVLVDSVFGTAIAIVHSDREGRRRQQLRRRAAAAIAPLVRQLLHRKITPCYETLYTEGAPGPPEASNVRGIDDGGPCANANEADWNRRHGHRRFGQTAF